MHDHLVGHSEYLVSGGCLCRQLGTNRASLDFCQEITHENVIGADSIKRLLLQLIPLDLNNTINPGTSSPGDRETEVICYAKSRVIRKINKNKYK